MIEHIWSVLCSRSVIDYETNNVSIQDIVEQIIITGEPVEKGFLPFPCEIITLWGRKKTNISAKGLERISFVRPSGRADVISESEIDLTKVERYRQRVKFPGLPISEAGKHYFKVEIRSESSDWKEVAAVPLVIAFQQGTN